MQRPGNLQKGSLVGIVSTARAISIDELRPLLELLDSWGLKARVGATIGAVCNQYAGDDALRARDLQQMLDDNTIDAIWCARGGYGTVRIIDRLDFTSFLKNPKWLIGYSDVTVLHSHLHNLGVETMHANMATEIADKSHQTRQSVRQVLFGESYQLRFKPGVEMGRGGNASGQLVGGNLSLLYALVGSPSAIDTKGKILFIEDLDEMLYHIDRMMFNLKRNGLLDQLSALVVGGMSDMKDNTIPFGKTAQAIVWEAVKDYDYPVVFNLPAGHIMDNQALILGRMAQLQAGQEEVTLTFFE